MEIKRDFYLNELIKKLLEQEEVQNLPKINEILK